MCRIPLLVAFALTFQLKTSSVLVVRARPADAWPVAFSAHCLISGGPSRGGRNANSINAIVRMERTASRRNAFNILPSLNQR
jgi:hypothetical protein